MKPAVPILRSFDETAIRAFYVDFLGFAVEFEHRFAPDLLLYFSVRQGGLLATSLRPFWRWHSGDCGAHQSA
jgi:catechol 2,3-dioxygenase-like lactoylglutathione lyase family enzyme